MISSSSSSSSSRVNVSSLCAGSGQRVDTVCRSPSVSTLLQLLQSVSSTSGSWWSRDSRCGSSRNGADVLVTLPARLSITSLPVAAWLQCACRRKSGSCRKGSRLLLSSSLSWTSRSSDDWRSWTWKQFKNIDNNSFSSVNFMWGLRSYKHLCDPYDDMCL